MIVDIEKRKDFATILGCGQSINHLSKENIYFINNNTDVWSLNNFIINDDIVPNFYSVEIKYGINDKFFKNILTKKQDIYYNTTFMVGKKHIKNGKNIIPNIIDINKFNIYPYKINFVNNGYVSPISNLIKIIRGSSITLLFDRVCFLKYKKIYICGIDLINSSYFWTDNIYYLNKYNIPLKLQWSNAFRGYRKEDRHKTYPITVKFLNEYIKYNNLDVINLITGKRVYDLASLL